MIIRTKALVIKEHIFGESDKFITLFTKELGKIQVVAPKAKKSDKGFASGTQLFVYGDFMMTSFKDTYRLISVEVIDMFHNIRNDLEALSYASYIAEFVQSVTEANLPQIELLKLTLLTLSALSKGNVPPKLIRRVFELRAVGLIGFMPQLEACIACGELLREQEEKIYYFSIEEGGLVCGSCVESTLSTVPICFSTLYTMKYILSAPTTRVFHFTVSEIVQRELDEICERYVAYYIDKTFKTVEFISRIENL